MTLYDITRTVTTRTAVWPGDAPYRVEPMARIADGASGFVYYVSVAGVTGAGVGAEADISAGVNQARRLSNLPVAVGFGVRTPVLLVIALTNNFIIVNNHAADHGIWTDRSPSQLGQLQCPLHVNFVPVHYFCNYHLLTNRRLQTTPAQITPAREALPGYPQSLPIHPF